jgi:D-sedoheptulose 7-phosphate isomerase
MLKGEFEEAFTVLQQFIADDNNFVLIEKAGQLMVDAIRAGRKIISCGNGGSMCDAMHFAEELSGQYRHSRPALPAIAISDASHLTCAANDYGFEAIFSRYIEAIGNEGDILLAISTSGNSPNIIKAAEAALQRKMKVVALTGNDGGKLASLANVEIRVPYKGYSDRIQEIHIKIIHSLILYIEHGLFPAQPK